MCVSALFVFCCFMSGVYTWGVLISVLVLTSCNFVTNRRVINNLFCQPVFRCMNLACVNDTYRGHMFGKHRFLKVLQCSSISKVSNIIGIEIAMKFIWSPFGYGAVHLDATNATELKEQVAALPSDPVWKTISSFGPIIISDEHADLRHKCVKLHTIFSIINDSLDQSLCTLPISGTCFAAVSVRCYGLILCTDTTPRYTYDWKAYGGARIVISTSLEPSMFFIYTAAKTADVGWHIPLSLNGFAKVKILGSQELSVSQRSTC